MKKILLLMLCLLLACPAVMAEEDEPQIYEAGENIEFYILDDGTACIDRYDNEDAHATIPSRVSVPSGVTGAAIETDQYGNKYIRVTGIEYFYDGTYYIDEFNNSISTYIDTLEKVDIHNGITYIPKNPFYWNRKLTDIYVSAGHPTLATIDGVLFEKPTRRLVAYPLGFSANEYIVPEGIQEIGNYSFATNDNLNTIRLPGSLKVIGNDAFYACTALRHIELPEGLTTIGDSAFYGCRLPDRFVIPDTVTSIGSTAFYCVTASEIVVPSSVTYIGDWAFNKKDGYWELYEVPYNGVTLIVERGSYAEEYANEYGYRYEYIDGEADLSWLTDDSAEEVIEDTSWLEDEE